MTPAKKYSNNITLVIKALLIISPPLRGILRDGVKIQLSAWMDGKRTPQQIAHLQDLHRALESPLRNITMP